MPRGLGPDHRVQTLRQGPGWKDAHGQMVPGIGTQLCGTCFSSQNDGTSRTPFSIGGYPSHGNLLGRTLWTSLLGGSLPPGSRGKKGRSGGLLYAQYSRNPGCISCDRQHRRHLVKLFAGFRDAKRHRSLSADRAQNPFCGGWVFLWRKSL